MSDRAKIESISEAQGLLDRYHAGDIIPYDDVDDIDDRGWREVMRDSVVEEPGEGYRILGICTCGCGERTQRTVRLLPEYHRAQAEAMRWAETSIRRMREYVYVVDGHEVGGIDGYVTES